MNTFIKIYCSQSRRLGSIQKKHKNNVYMQSGFTEQDKEELREKKGPDTNNQAEFNDPVGNEFFIVLL